MKSKLNIVMTLVSVVIICLAMNGCADRMNRPMWPDVSDGTMPMSGTNPASHQSYGERTPMDQNNSYNGDMGTGLSSSIPPIEGNEITDESYEDGVMTEREVDDITFQDGDVAEQEEEDLEDPVDDWLAEEGKSLQDLLREWCNKSGWRLVWNTNRNYKLRAGAMFRGRFTDVSAALVRAFARAKPAPLATFYRGNRVLVIETLEDENAY